jgi:hypothetical protein
MNTHRHNHKQEDGIGLYSHEQIRNTTPFQYGAQIVVGSIPFAVGVALVVLGKTLSGFTLVIIGGFMAHAGVIFWWKRLAKRSTRL